MNRFKTKLVTLHHHRTDLELLLIMLDVSSPKEAPCFEHLLALILDPQVELMYIIAKDAE